MLKWLVAEQYCLVNIVLRSHIIFVLDLLKTFKWMCNMILFLLCFIFYFICPVTGIISKKIKSILFLPSFQGTDLKETLFKKKTISKEYWDEFVTVKLPTVDTTLYFAFCIETLS